MKNSEAVTKICPFMSKCGAYATLIKVHCKCEECMAWENTSFGTNIKEEDKEGYCKRLEKWQNNNSCKTISNKKSL